MLSVTGPTKSNIFIALDGGLVFKEPSVVTNSNVSLIFNYASCTRFMAPKVINYLT